ncbi:MAG: GPW/gp25 family protein [Minisyncoccia bacterium]
MATVNIDTNRTFKDLDLNFNIHPVKKDINTHSNEYAIVNSIKNLVLTNHYERPFQPNIGSNIRQLLFDNLDAVTAASIQREIEETINNFEPRAGISNVNVVAAPDENGYKVELEFFVLNNTSPVTINFFLERIR